MRDTPIIVTSHFPPLKAACGVEGSGSSLLHAATTHHQSPVFIHLLLSTKVWDGWIACVQGWREKVGPDYPLMLDCYMALTVPYSIRLAQELKPYGLKWMEEYLIPVPTDLDS